MTQLRLNSILATSKERMAAPDRRPGFVPAKPECGSQSITSFGASNVPSLSEAELLQRTCPLLLPGLELSFRSRSRNRRARRIEPAKPECGFESATFNIPVRWPIPKSRAPRPAPDVISRAIAKLCNRARLQAVPQKEPLASRAFKPLKPPQRLKPQSSTGHERHG
jgi:hypothetical protein